MRTRLAEEALQSPGQYALSLCLRSHEQTPFTRSAPKMSSLFVANAHRGDGKRFVGRANEELTAFLELEATHPRLQKNENEEIESKRAPLVTSTLDTDAV